MLSVLEAAVDFFSRYENVDRILELAMITVSEEFSGRGVGRRLVQVKMAMLYDSLCVSGSRSPIQNRFTLVVVSGFSNLKKPGHISTAYYTRFSMFRKKINLFPSHTTYY